MSSEPSLIDDVGVCQADTSVICINPPDVDGKAYKPWRLRDSPESIAAGEAAHPELAKTAFVRVFSCFSFSCSLHLISSYPPYPTYNSQSFLTYQVQLPTLPVPVRS